MQNETSLASFGRLFGTLIFSGHIVEFPPQHHVLNLLFDFECLISTFLLTTSLVAFLPVLGFGEQFGTASDSKAPQHTD
jgi:hypothetical protein